MPSAGTAVPSDSSNSGRADRPFKTLQGELESIAVMAEVYPITRNSRTATASVRFRMAGSGTSEFRIFRSLNDHNPEVADKELTAPDGLRLIDSNAMKAYLPATIGDGECLCSPRINGFHDRHKDLTVAVTFGAPPASTKTIDLLIPGFGTVSDVPLQ